jgi:hypothetical protein
MEKKIKHLEMIQAVIVRMGNNSFLLKGWSVTLISALFAIALQDGVKSFVVLAFLPAFIFWALDGFYLWQERLFRSLYDHVRELEEGQIDFSMDVSRFGTTDKWIKAIFADITILFHIPILLAIICVLLLFHN